jgi:nucleoside-diphosphate-sugar epimerase
VARALIVGCGCRGRTLGAALANAGWAVRGTSRSEEGRERIAAAGLEPAAADPDRPGTVLELIEDVAVVHWLLGSAQGQPESVAAINGTRLESLLFKLVDTPVRGIVYEAAGAADPAYLRHGARTVREAGERWRIRFQTVSADPADPAQWLEAMLAATDELLTGSG